MNFQKIRGNKNIRLLVLFLIIAIAIGMWWYGNKTDNKILKTGGVVVGTVAGIATGLEIADTDFDLKKLYETGSLKEALLKRDEKGNLIMPPKVFCDAQEKGFYDYDCKDFKTQEEAQRIFDTCGSKDVHGLDRDKDGKVCEALPRAER